MTFKRYIKINGKRYGPYSYKSYRDSDGRVKNKYFGKGNPEKKIFSATRINSLGKGNPEKLSSATRASSLGKNKDSRQQIKQITFSDNPQIKSASFRPIIMPLTAIISIIALLAFLGPYLTGFSISAFEKPEGINLEKTSFSPNEPISGYVSLYLREGELLPAQTRVTFALEKEGQIKYSNELSLSDFFEISDIVLEKTNGDFYSTKTSLPGEGEGYGFIGRKITYPEISFELKSVSAAEEPTQTATNETEVIPIKQPQENITEEIPIQPVEQPSEQPTEVPSETPIEEQVPAEQLPEETPSETPIEMPAPLEQGQQNVEVQVIENPSIESAPESSSAQAPSEQSPSITGAFIGIITGKAVSGDERTISASVSADSPFTYSGEFELVSGSIRAGNKTLDDSVLNIKIENGETAVSTDYSEEESGFGADYLGNETERIDLDLSKLNISLDEEGDYVAKVSFKYENSEIAKFEQEITVNSTLEAVETTMIEDDPTFDAIIDSAEYDNETGILKIIFHHDANKRLPVSIAFNETAIDYSFSRLIADKGENVTLTVNNWDESKYFEVKVGEHSEVVGIGKAPRYNVNGKIKNSKEEKVNATVEFIKKKSIKQTIENNAETAEVQKGVYDIRIVFNETPVKEIIIEDYNLNSNISGLINVDDVPESGNYVETYAIDPAELNFTSATVTVTAKGSELYKCKNWNFTAETCIDGNWTKIMDITPGQNYTVTLTAADPGYAEYNSTSGAPKCNSSDSPCIANTSLLKCSGPSTSPGPEPNQPNTLDTCTDKTSGACYSFYSSVENITITDLNNSVFKAGDTVNVTVSYFCYNLEQTFIWYTNSTSSINWKKVGNIACSGTIVNRTYSYSFKLDSLSGAHAVRAIIMSNPNATNQNLACPVDPQTRDVDDVAFRVDSLDSTPPLISFVFPTPNDGNIMPANSVYVNVSSSDANQHYTLLDWNSSLIGWWRLEQGNGTYFVDESIYGNNGTCSNSNCPNYTASGQYGGAYTFDGSNDYIQGLTYNFANHTEISIGFWVKPARDYHEESSKSYFAHKGYGKPFEFFFDDSADSVYFKPVNNGSSSFSIKEADDTYLDADTWYHFVAVVNGSFVGLYRNGVLTASRNDFTGTLMGGTDNLVIGGKTSSNFFNGTIDEVAVFKRALSSQEILALYNATANQYYNNFTNLSNTNYTFKAYAVDAAGNKNQTETRTVTINADATLPVITVYSPQNITYSETNQVLVNFTATDNVNVSSKWYYNETSNRTYTAPETITLADGSHTFTFYANDTSNNVDSTSVTFSIDSCVPSLTNTSWSSWINLTCSGSQMNQSRFLTQYDSNNCGEISNQTIYEYQLVGPAYANTSWSDWLNISCLSTDKMNQTRNLTQYDIYSCVANLTLFEYRQTETCDYCTPSLANTTWTNWYNITVCLLGDYYTQARNLTQYDSNNCGEVANQTFYEYQNQTCDFCTPSLINTTWSSWQNLTCSGTQMNQSRNLTQYDSNNCGEVSNQTIYSYQLVGPTYQNTTFTDWYNITACMPGDYYTQERNATQYDTYSCAANSTVSEHQNLSCIYNRLPVTTSPSITPATAYTNNDLTCSFTVTDEDADSLTANYTWYKNNAVNLTGSISAINGTESSVILGNGNTTKNEIWNCSIIPYDTKSYGAEKSAARTISNSLPTAPVVDVIPNSPSDNEDLAATIASASADADNDTITYAYQWYKNDALQAGQTSNTLSKLLTSVGENWKCIVTPNDGTSNGATGQDNVTIFSSDTTPPTITIVNPSNGANLAAGTTSTIINITTNENAVCRYNTTNPAFAFDEGTNFTTTGNSAHSFLFSGMSDGNSYTLYYKCNDSAGNVNANSTEHSFSVSAALYCGDGSCNNGETCSTCPSDCGSCGGGGGSGGGGGISQITDVSDSFKKAGDIVEKSLGRGNGIRFSLNNESHTIEVNQIFSDSVNLKISSEVIYVTVKNNGIEKVDINKNGYYDIAISLKSLTATAAVFEFRLLSDTEEMIKQEFCAEKWKCSEFTECTIEGIQVRACSDENKCGTTMSKPAEIQSCAKPTCSDRIQNQGELGIDCGGPCAKRCGIAEIAGSIVKVPAPEEAKKSGYGIGLMALMFLLIGMLATVSRIETKVKAQALKKKAKKEIKKFKFELLLAHIIHIMIVLAIILLVYYFIKS